MPVSHDEGVKSSLILFLAAAAGTVFAASPAPQLLTEAQAAYLRGDIDAARAKFESVLVLDPKNQTAIGYLKNINARESGGSPEKQLARVIMPKIEFREASMTAALDYLKQSISKQTDGKTTVNFVVQLPEEQANAPVTLSLSNVPFTEVLRYLGTLTKTSFVYDRYAIMVRPAASTAQAKAESAPAR